MNERTFLVVGIQKEQLTHLPVQFCANDHVIHAVDLQQALSELPPEKSVNCLIIHPDCFQDSLKISCTTISDTPKSDSVPGDSRQFPNIIGCSQKMQQVCQRIGKVAPTHSTVLIQGETGTGKELVAEAIHCHSSRARKPFVKVNCAALPETLLESELFGHIRGAFTGAIRNYAGRFKQADGGTLLLDEIGSLPLGSQAKLLRVLQDQKFEPLGSSVTTKVDVRIVAADNQDLSLAVNNGKFREDLFYRLNVFPIPVPPLRERKEDIPILIEYFYQKHRPYNHNQTGVFTTEVIEILTNYHWPGNVRELENTIQFMSIVQHDLPFDISHLPPHLLEKQPIKKAQEKITSLRQQLLQAEKQIIERALTQSNGIKKKAARILGIHPKNMGYLLRRHGL